MTTVIAKRYGEVGSAGFFPGKIGSKSLLKVKNYSGSKILRSQTP